MSSETAYRRLVVAELRREFDNSFAALPETPGDGRAVFLNIRVGGEALAVRTLHITGLAKRRRIVALPTSVPGLLGVMALRGDLLPVYDLAALLGLPACDREPGWLIFAHGKTPVALCFDELEGQIEVDGACLSDTGGSRVHKHLRLMARMDAGPRAVIDIPGIVIEIRKTAGLVKPVKE